MMWCAVVRVVFFFAVYVATSSSRGALFVAMQYRWIWYKAERAERAVPARLFTFTCRSRAVQIRYHRQRQHNTIRHRAQGHIIHALNHIHTIYDLREPQTGFEPREIRVAFCLYLQ